MLLTNAAPGCQGAKSSLFLFRTASTEDGDTALIDRATGVA